MVWRANTGWAWPTDESARPVHFGVSGQPDILGVTPSGRGLGVEVKSVRGRQSEQQRRFQKAWEAHGGLYILARSAAEAVEALKL